MLVAVQLPVDWNRLGFPDPFTLGEFTVGSGERGWAWSGPAPDFGVLEVPPARGLPAPTWDIDHVVLLVPDLDAAVAVIEATERPPRKRVEIRGRRTAFFVVGTVLEVIEEDSVDHPLLWGVALQTETPLADLAGTWRDAGHQVTDPRPAFQEGREIITLPDAGAGVAVMSPREVESRTA